MTKLELEGLIFHKVSILAIKDHKILILLCDNELMAEKLHAIIKANRYLIKSMITNKKTHKIELEFCNTEFSLIVDTRQTSKDYPPLDWLTSGQVSHLTTGYKNENELLQWKDNLLPMFSPSLN